MLVVAGRLQTCCHMVRTAALTWLMMTVAARPMLVLDARATANGRASMLGVEEEGQATYWGSRLRLALQMRCPTWARWVSGRRRRRLVSSREKLGAASKGGVQKRSDDAARRGEGRQRSAAVLQRHRRGLDDRCGIRRRCVMDRKRERRRRRRRGR